MRGERLHPSRRTGVGSPPKRTPPASRRPRPSAVAGRQRRTDVPPTLSSTRSVQAPCLAPAESRKPSRRLPSVDTGSDLELELRRSSSRVLEASTLVNEILLKAPLLELPDWYVGAGCIAGTVWNKLHGFPDGTCIKDCDVVYFDDVDTSYEAEDAGSRRRPRCSRIFRSLSSYGIRPGSTSGPNAALGRGSFHTDRPRMRSGAGLRRRRASALGPRKTDG